MKKLAAKRLGALLLALVMCLALAVTALANETVVYTGDAFAASRTRAEIGRRYAEALAAGGSYSDSDSATWYSVPASVKAPYAAGALTADTHAAMTAMTDYYRWLVGVAPLKAPSKGSNALQKGALVRNFDFNHSISGSNKPADMDQDLWNDGAAARHNILAFGYTPRGAINGYLNEGYDRKEGMWDTIGHRMALLSGNVSELQYGYAGHVQIGVIAARSNTVQQPFAAFPAAGYMPLSEVSARYSAWSVELNSKVLNPGQTVVVTVTNTQTGERYECTQKNGLLRAGQTIQFAQPVPAAGLKANHYAEGETYRVQITGLTDVATGGAAEIDYTVQFFDVSDYMPATDPCDGGENCPSRKFVDVDHSPDCWYHAPVDWAVLNEITAGINDDHFDPNGRCTRSQAVTFLWRAMGKPEPTTKDNPFTDVSESEWYYKPVLWAVENSITLGVGGGRFDPDGTCNRSQIVTFLWRAVGKPDPTGTGNPFTDVSAEKWYYKPVLWAVENGITAGVGGGRFDPDGTCIRSQIVTFLYRCMK